MKDTFVKILEWVGGSPFRLFALCIISILGAGGWFFYTEKDAFMASYRAQQALPKMNGKYEEATAFIMKRSNADLVAIFDVNSLLNSRKLAYLYVRGEGRIKTYDGYDVKLFTANHSNNSDVISLMAGDFPCSSYSSPQSFLGFVYKEKGVNFMCRISVPPEPSKFIGQISVGWKEQPEDIDGSKTLIRIAAEMLFTEK
jgi:hypothetical protein